MLLEEYPEGTSLRFVGCGLNPRPWCLAAEGAPCPCRNAVFALGTLAQAAPAAVAARLPALLQVLLLLLLWS